MSRNLKLTKSLYSLEISNKRVKNESGACLPERVNFKDLFSSSARATAGFNAKHEISFVSLLKTKLKPEYSISSQRGVNELERRAKI